MARRTDRQELCHALDQREHRKRQQGHGDSSTWAVYTDLTGRKKALTTSLWSQSLTNFAPQRSIGAPP